jgi:hypothetical protein
MLRQNSHFIIILQEKKIISSIFLKIKIYHNLKGKFKTKIKTKSCLHNF